MVGDRTHRRFANCLCANHDWILNKLQASLIDICLQVTDSLLYLYLDLLHSSVSSDAVQVVSFNIAKLGMTERLVSDRGRGGSSL